MFNLSIAKNRATLTLSWCQDSAQLCILEPELQPYLNSGVNCDVLVPACVGVFAVSVLRRDRGIPELPLPEWVEPPLKAL